MSTSQCHVTAALQCKKKHLSAIQTPGLQIKLYNTINDIPRADWQQLLQPEDTFMSLDYWKAFEASVSANVEFRYMIFHQHHEVAGLAAFQIIRFDVSNMNSADDVEKMSAGKKLLTRALKPLSFRLLVCGNTFMTGNYGLRFRGGQIEQTQAEFLLKGIEDVKIAEKKAGRPISGVLVKDFYEDEARGLDLLSDTGYLKLQVQPNMILDIDPEWQSFEGYLAAMSSKYRTRVKRALKDIKQVAIRPMGIEEITAKLPQIEDLYNQVIGQSSFKLATFDIGHLVPMKQAFDNSLICDGFFLNDELIGFTSLLEHEDELAAGMLGLNKDLQREYDLYFNMLIHIAKRGIERRASRIVMGRTAMEIKSSIGAVPKDMDLYVRHTGGLRNYFVKRIISFLNKPEEWNQRHPFRKGGAGDTED